MNATALVLPVITDQNFKEYAPSNKEAKLGILENIRKLGLFWADHAKFGLLMFIYPIKYMR